MKKNLFLTAVIMFIATVNLFAEEYLRIGDVRTSWSTEQGSIDKAEFIITPKGLYAECQMILDISVNCTSFKGANDSLEIQLGFVLPKEAEVTDMWLWVENIPVRAGIYDRWTASQVYEGIVKRRKDPALLVKNSDTDYSLRIFPLMPNLPRKIKITYLVPFDKVTGMSTVSLPLNILKLSKCAVGTVRIVYRPALNMGNPVLTELPQTKFTLQSDNNGQYYVATPAYNSISDLNSLTLSLLNATSATSFAGSYSATNSSQGIYQLELNLKQLLGIQQAKKTVFMLDFVKTQSSVSATQVLQTLKSYIATYFTQGDSVNFMFSGYYTKIISNTWISADSASLAQTFSKLDTTQFSGYSNLPTMLMDGIDFIQKNKRGGNIVLIASSTAFQKSSEANALISDVITFMGNTKIPIHTVNLDDKSNQTWAGNNYYRGNEYLYVNLANLTGGEYQGILSYSSQSNPWGWYYYYAPEEHSYQSLLSNIFPKLSGYFSALNVYTLLSSGFTYSTYTFSSANGFVYFDSPYRQVGKYTGTFPLNIIVSAQTPDGKIYNTQLSINQSQMFALDSVSQNIWAGQYLREMLAYNQSNSVVYQIIQTSMKERVLTEYTAFLALEPSMQKPDTVGIPIPVDGTKGGVQTFENMVGISEQNTDSSVFYITCYPNPVTATAFFEYTLPKATHVLLEIYSIRGEKVATIINEKQSSGKHSSSFDVSSLSAGVYFYTLITDENKETKRMVVVR